MREETQRDIVAAIIPAWNESETIEDVIEEVAGTGLISEIIVIDDGSTDDTATRARRCGAVVLSLPTNMGVGAALRTGFLYVQRNNFSRCIQVDGDGQHPPEYIRQMLQVADEQRYDVLIGARFAGVGAYRMSRVRYWMISALSKFLGRLNDTVLTDATCGFRVFSPRAIDVFARALPADYLGDTIEALVLAHKNNLRVGQIGVEMRQRQGGVPSHSPVKAARYLARSIYALLIALSRKVPV